MSRTAVILYALGFLAFLLLGVVQAGYGPAYPLLGREFALPPGAVGAVASLNYAGSALGSLLLGAALMRLSLRGSLVLAAALLAAGVGTVATSHLWGVLLVGAGLGGLGYGMLSAGFNVAFAELGPGPSNLVNGLFGVGAVVAPAVIAALGRSSHRPPFLLMTGVAALLMLGVQLLWPHTRRPSTAAAAGARPVSLSKPGADMPGLGPGVPARRPSSVLFAVFGVCFFLYVGIEAGLGNWATTYFTSLPEAGRGRGVLFTSLYWLALTVGRFAFAAVGSRVAPVRVLLFSILGALLGMAGMLISSVLAPVGLVLTGFCIAPIFSTLISWFARVQPPHLAGYMLTLGSAGGALLPAITGALLAPLGASAIPLVPLIIAALLLLAVLNVQRRLRPHLHPQLS